MKREGQPGREPLKALTVRARRLKLIREFWTVCLPLIAAKAPRWAGQTATDSYWLHTASGIPRVQYDVWARKSDAGCGLYIDAGPDRAAWNKAVFDALASKRPEIEAAFGNRLDWERLDRAGASVVTWVAATGGYGSPRAGWPEIGRRVADDARRFEAAIGPYLKAAIGLANG